MADESALVPVWTLATEAVAVPGLVSDGDMTPERLADLRTALSDAATAYAADVAGGTFPASEHSFES